MLGAGSVGCFIGGAWAAAGLPVTLIGRRKIDLEVDGGINAETAPLVVKAGANVLVAGNAIFAGNDAKTYTPRIKAIRDAATTIRV